MLEAYLRWLCRILDVRCPGVCKKACREDYRKSYQKTCQKARPHIGQTGYRDRSIDFLHLKR